MIGQTPLLCSLLILLGAGPPLAHRFVSGPKENPAAATLQIESATPNPPVEASVFVMPAK
jgi:hypothetical protein